MTTSSLVPKRCTIDPLAQINSMVSSWTTNGKATTAGSLLVFDDNVGEDGLSSQSTHKVNIHDPYYCLVWATKLSLAAIGLVFLALVLGYKSFNCSMYHVPVPTLFSKFV